MERLNRKSSMRLPDSVKRANGQRSDRPNRIMHIGVGGFHRAHQAFALNKLIEQDPDAYSCWRITGVGLLPSDRKIIENFRAQDGLYTLKAVAYDGSEELQLIGSIKRDATCRRGCCGDHPYNSGSPHQFDYLHHYRGRI